MSSINSLISASLKRCIRVNKGVEELRPFLTPVMPFNGLDTEEMTLEQRMASLAFLKRFEQFQDLLARLVRSVISWEGGDSRSMSMRDLGDWLEKRHLVSGAIDWMQTVQLRNQLVHEYPIEEIEQVRRLNESWRLVENLVETLASIQVYLTEKGFDHEA